MHPQEVILSLILLLTGAVVSYTKVSGVVGQPVTLPCTYSVANGEVTSMCWGRRECPMFKCSDEIIWTNGFHVTFQKHMRYQLKGYLLKGNVSLTIENATEADSGLYCCRVEHRGWFNDMKVTLSLEIKPGKTSVPTSPRVSTSALPTPAPTQNHKPVSTSPSPSQPAETQSTTLWETGTQPTSSPLYSHPTDGNGTVTQPSEGVWHNNQTQESSAHNSWMTTTKGIYVGICIFALMLLAVLVVVIVKKYFYIINKMQQARTVVFKGPQTRALQSAAEVRVQAQDNIYIIEDNLYVMD
ncbi:PREDICTED: hepatitis A virus cellular receptor 1 [Galeopterus variegatus]|uniref:Hepatitis A virus cellular receptor 1 n=1 Tax=Galeopterus variegatus TaxID=482537 RepID=A0ABM0QWA2_GALVR|nr:PREDICTED: hepatitis A virus cellular receptor 1 [Galeopterus variegatus]